MRWTAHISWLFVLALASANASALTIAIDPGHGGIKDGAFSTSGVKEKDVSLAVAMKLRAMLLSDKNIEVVLTRDADRHVELHDRTELANKAKADLLISIHCNSMPTNESRRNTSGIETYFLSADSSDAEADALAARENADIGDTNAGPAGDPVGMILQELTRSVAHADSKRLAEDVHESVVKALAAKNRGIRQAPFIVLLGAEMPAILVEIGFISHPVEGKHLADPAYQTKIATALRDAIRTFERTVLARRAAPPPSPTSTPPPPAPAPPQ